MSGSDSDKAGDPAQLYREIIVQHAREPVGFNKNIAATHQNEQFNPLCGDRINLMLKLEGDEVVDAAFEGESCAICKASASLLCELAPNHSRSGLIQHLQWLKESLADNPQPTEQPQLKALLGVRAYPSRIKCALLPWEALDAALNR